MGMSERSVAERVAQPISVKNTESSEFATFRTIRGTGKGHQIRLSPTEEEDVQIPGEKGARRVPKQGTGVKIKFSEGTYMTNDPKIIEALLNDETGRYGFGVQYEINTADPTGYWRKRAKTDERFGIKTHEVVEVSVARTGQGALNSRVAQVA